MLCNFWNFDSVTCPRAMVPTSLEVGISSNEFCKVFSPFLLWRGWFLHCIAPFQPLLKDIYVQHGLQSKQQADPLGQRSCVCGSTSATNTLPLVEVLAFARSFGLSLLTNCAEAHRSHPDPVSRLQLNAEAMQTFASPFGGEK